MTKKDLVPVNGLLSHSTPEAIAMEYKQRYGDSMSAANALIMNALKKSFGTGFIKASEEYASLGVMGDSVIKTQMVASIAVLGGYNVSDDEVQANIILCLGANVATDFVRKICIGMFDDWTDRPKMITTELGHAAIGSVITVGSTFIIGTKAKKLFLK